MTDSKSRPPVVQLHDFLERREAQLKAALPAHIKPERMIRLAMTEFTKNKDLQRCSTESIYSSIIVAAQVGLEIGVLGQAYLVPYKGTCTLVPGWQGIVSIVSRSGRSSVRSGCVYEGDDFDYDTGSSPFVKHKPVAKQKSPDKITYVYAIGEIAGLQDRIIEVWPIEAVREHFRKYNKVGEKHYGNKHWEMYARKVPLLQVCKYLPKTVEMSNLIEASYAAERGENMVFDEAGNPVTSVYRDDPPAPKADSGIKRPRRADAAQDVPDKKPAGAAELASPGQVAYLKRKAGDAKTLKAALKAAGLGELDVNKLDGTLTLDGFNAVKDELK